MSEQALGQGADPLGAPMVANILGTISTRKTSGGTKALKLVGR